LWEEEEEGLHLGFIIFRSIWLSAFFQYIYSHFAFFASFFCISMRANI